MKHHIVKMSLGHGDLKSEVLTTRPPEYFSGTYGKTLDEAKFLSTSSSYCLDEN